MKDVTSVFGDAVEVTSFKKRNEEVDFKCIRKEKSTTLESADLELALSKSGFGKYNLLVLLIAMPVAFSSGLVTGSVSFVLPSLGCEFNCSNFEKGILQVASYGGMIVSGFFWGSASDSFGRQKLVAYGFIMDGTFGILAALSPNLWVMILFKALSGGMNCGPSAIFMTYLSETFSHKYRDFAVLSIGLFSAFGNILQPGLAILITWYLSFEDVTIYDSYTLSSWRVYLIVAAFPSLMCGFGAMLLFESPKFLLQRGKSDMALKVCKDIYAWNTSLPSSTYPIQKIIDPSYESQCCDVPNQTFLQRIGFALKQSSALFKKPFLGRALMFFTIQFGFIASMNVLRLWLPEIFTIVSNIKATNSTGPNKLCDILEMSAGIARETTCGTRSPSSLNNMLFVNSFLLVGQIVFISSVKYLGKKTPVVFTTLVPAFFAAGMVFVQVEYIVYLVAVFQCLLNVAFFAIAFLVTETFPTSLRAVSLNATQLCGRAGVLVSLPIVSLYMFSHCYIIVPGVSITLMGIGIIAILLPTTQLTYDDKNNDVRA